MWDWNKFFSDMQEWIVFHGPKILLGILVLIGGLFLIRVLTNFLKKTMTKRKVNPSVRYFLLNLIAITLQILLIVLSLQIIGLQLTILSAIIAGFTVAAGLALSGTLQNFVSGILILYLKPYRVGDNININGQEGTVASIQLFFTEVMTYDHKVIIVPNSQLSNSVVVNLSREGKRRIDIDFKIPYAVDMALLRQTILPLVSSHENIDTEPAPRIGISKVDSEFYVVTVNAWTNAHGIYDTRISLTEKILDALKKAGVKFKGM